MKRKRTGAVGQMPFLHFSREDLVGSSSTCFHLRWICSINKVTWHKQTLTPLYSLKHSALGNPLSECTVPSNTWQHLKSWMWNSTFDLRLSWCPFPSSSKHLIPKLKAFLRHTGTGGDSEDHKNLLYIYRDHPFGNNHSTLRGHLA